MLLTGTASVIRGAQETGVTNGAAGAVPVSTCRVFQAWVSIGEPSADPLSLFCSIALTSVMSPMFKIDNFPGSMPPVRTERVWLAADVISPDGSYQESRSNFVWLAPLRIYIYEPVHKESSIRERSLPATEQLLYHGGSATVSMRVGSELTVNNFRDSLGGDIDQQVRFFRRFVLRTNSRQSI